MIKKDYIRHLLTYGSGKIVSSLVIFLLLPLFTFKFAPAEYAIYSIISIFITFMNLIYLMGIQESLFSYFYKEDSSSYHFTLMTSVYITLFFSSTIFSFLIYFLRFQLSEILFSTKDYAHYFSLIAVILWFNSFFAITQNFLNIIEKSSSYVKNSLTNVFVMIVLFGYGYITDQFNIENILNWLITISIISSLSSAFYMNEILKKLNGNKYFSIKIIKSCISFGLPMIPGSISLLILSLSDRYLLSKLSPNGLYDTGIYAVSYKIGLIVSFVVSLFSLVYLPYAMRISQDKNARKVYQKFFNLYLILGSLISIFVILFSPEIFHIFLNKTYYKGIRYVFFGAVSNFLVGVFYLINIAFYNLKRSKTIALVIISGALLNILLNIISIPRYGIIGAGFSSI